MSYLVVVPDAMTAVAINLAGIGTTTGTGGSGETGGTGGAGGLV